MEEKGLDTPPQRGIPFKPGNKAAVGRGRNKVSQRAKETFALAMQKVAERHSCDSVAEFLAEWASQNPNNMKELVKLYARLIPVDVAVGPNDTFGEFLEEIRARNAEKNMKTIEGKAE